MLSLLTQIVKLYNDVYVFLCAINFFKMYSYAVFVLYAQVLECCNYLYIFVIGANGKSFSHYPCFTCINCRQWISEGDTLHLSRIIQIHDICISWYLYIYIADNTDTWYLGDQHCLYKVKVFCFYFNFIWSLIFEINVAIKQSPL